MNAQYIEYFVNLNDTTEKYLDTSDFIDCFVIYCQNPLRYKSYPLSLRFGEYQRLKTIRFYFVDVLKDKLKVLIKNVTNFYIERKFITRINYA
jgi:hypothetical protein